MKPHDQQVSMQFPGGTMKYNPSRLQYLLSSWNKNPDSAKVEMLLVDIRAMNRENEELRAALDVLKGCAAAEDIPLIDHPHWAVGLTMQQRVLMGILMKASPRAVDRWEILDRLPPRDHAEERNPGLVNVQVGHLRKRFGYHAIETVEGGYRLSPTLRQQLDKAA